MKSLTPSRRPASLLCAVLLTAPVLLAGGDGPGAESGGVSGETPRIRSFTLIHASEDDPAHLSNLKAAPEGLVLSSPARIGSLPYFKILPGAEYVMTLTVTNKGKKGLSLYAGADVCCVWFQNVSRIPGTETELLRAVKKGDRAIGVRSLRNWKPGKYRVAFLAAADGSDLPNRNLTGLDRFEETESGEGNIFLSPPGAPCDAPEGSLVRLHQAEGSTFNWAGSIWLPPGKEIEWSVRMKDVARGRIEDGKFWPGARDFRWVIAPVGGAVSPESPLVFREIRLVRLLPEN